jgi:GxxExxY protein
MVNVLEDIQLNAKDYPFQQETYSIIGLCMEVHKTLGRGLAEVVYKDAFQIEFKQNNIPFEREKKYEITYKGTPLHHHYYADFIIFDKIILEVKAISSIVEEHYKQVINYLALSKNKVGLIVNFGEDSLVHKRVIL